MPYTPGPWQIGFTGNDGSFEIGTNYRQDDPACFEPGGFVIAVRSRLDHKAEESLANARLIAAAPDLLSALTGLIGLGRKDTSNSKYDGYYDEARAALAKARG